MRSFVLPIILAFFLASCSGNDNATEKNNAEGVCDGQSETLVSDTLKDSSSVAQNPDPSADTVGLRQETIKQTKKVIKKDSTGRKGKDKKQSTVKKEFVPKLDAKKKDEKIKNTVEYHYKRGLVLFKINKYEEGVREFDTAIRMDPEMADSYINRGKGLLELKQYEAARRDFEQAVNLEPQDTTGYLYLGMAYYKLGKYRDAVDINTEVIILAPRKAKGYYNRGVSYGLLKEYDKAIADFNQAIALKSDYADAFYNRGLAYYFSGDHKAACEDWQMAKYYGNEKAVYALDNYCN